MKKLSKLSVELILFLVSTVAVCSAQKNPLVFKISISNSIVTTNNDLVLDLTLLNTASKAFPIPSFLNYGYKDDVYTDIYFEVEKLVHSTFKKRHGAADIDRIPRYDSIGTNLEEQYSTILPNTTFKTTFNINGYYQFDRGKYKVRAIFRSRKKIPGAKIVCSNWIFFEVKAKYVLPFDIK